MIGLDLSRMADVTSYIQQDMRRLLSALFNIDYTCKPSCLQYFSNYPEILRSWGSLLNISCKLSDKELFYLTLMFE